MALDPNPQIGAIIPDGMGGYLRFNGDGWAPVDASALSQPGNTPPPSASNGDTQGINPITGKPYTGLTPGPTSGIDPSIGLATPPGLHYDNSLTGAPQNIDNNPPPGTSGPGPTGTAPGGPVTPPGPGLLSPFPDAPPTYTPQPLPTLGGSTTTIPGAPPVPTIAPFQAPSQQDALNEPGYLFSEKQGSDELKNWLAAHGTFNDSSAAQALTDYGQNAAATQYGNVWNRAYQTWQGNVQAQLAPWQMAFQNWQTGTVNPTEQQFSVTAPLTANQNQNTWANAFNTWLQKFDIFKDQRDSTFNKILSVATA